MAMPGNADAVLCLRCGGGRVVPGGISTGPNGGFVAYETKGLVPQWFLNSMPQIGVGRRAFVCLDCGLLWSDVNLEQAREKIRIWGSEELKERMERSRRREPLPIPAAPPAASVDDLPIPADWEETSEE